MDFNNLQMYKRVCINQKFIGECSLNTSFMPENLNEGTCDKGQGTKSKIGVRGTGYGWDLET